MTTTPEQRMTPSELQTQGELAAYSGAMNTALSLMTAAQLSQLARLLGQLAHELSGPMDAMASGHATEPARAVQIQDAAIQRTYRKLQQQATQAAG